MVDFALLLALLVVFAGLIRPEWVRNGRAFGWGVVLIVVALLLGLMVGSKLGGWYTLVGVAYTLLRVGFTCALLYAFWPGGGLFSISGKEEQR